MDKRQWGAPNQWYDTPIFLYCFSEFLLSSWLGPSEPSGPLSNHCLTSPPTCYMPGSSDTISLINICLLMNYGRQVYIEKIISKMWSTKMILMSGSSHVHVTISIVKHNQNTNTIFWMYNILWVTRLFCIDHMTFMYKYYKGGDSPQLVLPKQPGFQSPHILHLPSTSLDPQTFEWFPSSECEDSWCYQNTSSSEVVPAQQINIKFKRCKG